MRKFYRNYLYISKNARISERVFVTRTVIAAVLIAVSMILYCSVTMAYFNDSVTSSGNVLKSGYLGATVEVIEGNVTLNNNTLDYGTTFTTNLSKNDYYEFNIEPTGNVTKGFCYITLTNKDDTNDQK